MPFNAIPAKDFLNRETELTYLKALAEMKGTGIAGNVLLEGARGIGKTEVLKQLYRQLFWEDKVVPFYYSFKTANLKGNYFARDYFTRFVKQYLSFIKKEPFIGENIAAPLHSLMPIVSSIGMDWLIDCIEDFQEHLKNNDLYWQIITAISGPVAVARKGGIPVLIMLDDFDAAEHLYESNRGDAHGLTSLFGEAMKNSLCPHVITGSTAALEAIFTDHSLIGGTEKLLLGPLPEDLAFSLFRSHLEKLKVTTAPGEELKFLGILRGNPLYIKNLAKAACKMNKDNLGEKDLFECYSFEVSEGETAFYWSSVFSRYVKDTAKRKAMIKLLMHSSEGSGADSNERLSKVLGLRESEIGAALDEIQVAGLIRNKDAVLQDFIHCLYMKETEGRNSTEVRDIIESKYVSENAGSCFELTIPMGSNAELVAAKAVEQIAKNINLDPELVNYLQLALIEICINAFEHSGSYEKKVFLKFITRPDKIEVIIESPGRQFSIGSLSEIPVEEKLMTGQKRGWGLRLVSGIMDNVKVERVNDRTRVILTKNIKGKEVLK